MMDEDNQLWITNDYLKDNNQYLILIIHYMEIKFTTEKDDMIQLNYE